jgi:hypothetical protein
MEVAEMIKNESPQAALPHLLAGDLREVDNHARSVFAQVTKPFPHHRSRYVTGLHYPADLIPEGAEILYTLENRGSATVVFIVNAEYVGHVRNDGSGTMARVAGRTADIAADALDRLTDGLPMAEPNGLQVTFWQQASSGGSSWTRSLLAPSWSEIAVNYPRRVRQQLGDVMRLGEVPQGGRVLLLTGVPGTGKTHAIRALFHEWRTWCRVHVVIDPERFFGSAEYMTDVLRSAEVRTERSKPRLRAVDSAPAEPSIGPGWNLIVCEDADDFIHAQARRHVGGGMGRLLNLADGLVGQGLNVAVLLTSNLRTAEIDPALMRPGRCLAAIDFKGFKPDEAQEWLGGPPQTTSSEPITLAELYEQRGKITQLGSRDLPVAVGGYL